MPSPLALLEQVPLEIDGLDDLPVLGRGAIASVRGLDLSLSLAILGFEEEGALDDSIGIELVLRKRHCLCRVYLGGSVPHLLLALAGKNEHVDLSVRREQNLKDVMEVLKHVPRDLLGRALWEKKGRDPSQSINQSINQ